MTHENLTLDDTASGKNAYYVACRSQQVAYCACLNRQRTIDSGAAVPADWNSCKDAARNRECRALQMRQEELVAGKGIFFQPRTLVQTLINVASDYFTNRDVPATRKRKPKTELDAIAAIGTGSTYGAALTAAATGHKAPPAVTGAKPLALVETQGVKAGSELVITAAGTAAPRPALSISPGESPMDFIKRLRASAAASATV